MTQTAQRRRVRDLTVRTIAAAVAVVLATVGLVAAPASPAAAASTEPLAVAAVFGPVCSQNPDEPGAKFTVVFISARTTFRTTTVFRNGAEFFADTTEVPAKKLEATPYGPLPDATWRFDVRLGTEDNPGRLLATLTATTDCVARSGT